ncbi:MAG: hypothetical protein RH942_18730 [Kiloniellaceae bacterium]
MTVLSGRPRSGTGRHAPRALALAGLFSLLLAACASQSEPAKPAAPDVNLGDGSLIAAILAMRENPQMRRPGAILCAAALQAENNPEFRYEAFFGALFSVPEEVAGLTFCKAVIEVAVSGGMTDEELMAFDAPEDIRDYTIFGKLLKELLYAHERLNSQQVMRLRENRLAVF